ncbi:MAG: hypothetical protein NTW93_09835 [Phycisphaerae bacterium]|nr:hypothetical protein [Phycisphaerae bacterium]
MENRLNLGSGHGWSGANIVFWNCQATLIQCDAPKGAMNFCIGSVGIKTEGDQVPAEPFGWWESPGVPVSPRSLYYQQLIDRLGQTAFENVTRPKQRTERIWSRLNQCRDRQKFTVFQSPRDCKAIFRPCRDLR